MKTARTLSFYFTGRLWEWHRPKLLCVGDGSARLGPGRWVLSAAHVIVSVARAQTALLCPCLRPSDGWQRLLTAGNEEARGEPGGQISRETLFSPSYLRLQKAPQGNIKPACRNVPSGLIVFTRLGKRWPIGEVCFRGCVWEAQLCVSRV